MSTHSLQLDSPVSAVIFDCDGTLSAIEGIDELAKYNNVTDIVQRLTQDAMGKSGMSVDLYQQRLDLVKPTQQQILTIGEEYIARQVKDISSVIHLLQRLKKSIYIVSAGLYPAVATLGESLNIPLENIYAVDIQFNADGNYVDFNRHSPLVNRNGKRVIVNEIKEKYNNTAFIGDGLNDLEVQDLVTRFIGYGGVYYRKNIESACQFYVKPVSMSAILPFVLTQSEVELLTPIEKDLYTYGLQALTEK